MNLVNAAPEGLFILKAVYAAFKYMMIILSCFLSNPVHRVVE